VQTLRGWYRNRVLRVVMTFMLTCFGTIAGEILFGFRVARNLF